METLPDDLYGGGAWANQQKNNQMISPRKLPPLGKSKRHVSVEISSIKDLDILTHENQKRQSFMLMPTMRKKMTFQSVRRLQQLQGRIARFICPDIDGNFFLIASHEYDRALNILYSENNDFHCSFIRDIEPDIISVFDCSIIFDEQNSCCNVSIASTRDGGFCLDNVCFKYERQGKKIVQVNKIIKEIDDFQDDNVSNNEEINLSQKQNESAPIEAICAKWPYITFSGLKPNVIIIVNAFDTNFIHRLILPDQPDRVLATYITETNDLFILTQQNEKFRVQCVDLDSSHRKEKELLDFVKPKIHTVDEPNYNQNHSGATTFTIENLFEYSQTDIEDRMFMAMHVRGESGKKTDITTNERLMIFLLHDGKVYSWLQTSKHKKQMAENSRKYQVLQEALIKNQLKKKNVKKHKSILINQEGFFTQNIIFPQAKLKMALETPSRNIIRLDDENFFLTWSNSTDQDFVNKQIGTLEEIQERKRIVQFRVDFSHFETQVVFEVGNSNEQIVNFQVDIIDKKLLILCENLTRHHQITNRIILYDLMTSTSELDTSINNPMFTGRLKSGNYLLAGGHIYFSNNIIKIRYDCLAENSSYKEDKIFDYYPEVFMLKQSERIIANCPLFSPTFHRLVYFIKNDDLSQASQVLIVPYLHEQKIYLHRNKPNTEYFYTQIESTKQLKAQTDQENQPEAEEINVQTNQRIVCMNLSESKYYVFSQRGILRSRIDISDLIKAFGQIKCVSPNGRNFVLDRSSDQNDIAINGNRQSQKLKTRKFENGRLSIFHLQENEFTFIKEVDIIQEMRFYIKQLKGQKESFDQKGVDDLFYFRILQKRRIQAKKLELLLGKKNSSQQAPNDWIFSPENVRFIYNISDSLDLLVKMEYVESQQVSRRQQFKQQVRQGLTARYYQGTFKKLKNQKSLEGEALVSQQKLHNSQSFTQQPEINNWKFLPSKISNFINKIRRKKEKSLQEQEDLDYQLQDHANKNLKYRTIFFYMTGNSLLRHHQSKSLYLKDKIKTISQIGREQAPLLQKKSFFSDLFQNSADEVWQNQLHMSTETKLAKKVFYPEKNEIDLKFFLFEGYLRISLLIGANPSSDPSLDDLCTDEDAWKKIFLVKLDEVSEENLIRKEKKMSNQFVNNSRFLIFWNKYQVKFIDIFKGELEIQKFKLQVKGGEQMFFVSDVRVGCLSSKYISILVNFPNQKGRHCIIIWNLQDNVERNTYDVHGDNFEVIWDQFGNPFVLQNPSLVSFVKLRCTLNCYVLPRNLKARKNANFIYSRVSTNVGNRFDGQNHNFLLMAEYCSLSFSFMTFLIKDRLDNKQIKDQLFDKTPFVYLFNCSTAFLDSELVRLGHESLEEVLNNLIRQDKTNLGQLNYFRRYYLQLRDEDEDGKSDKTSAKWFTLSESPLHIAFGVHNNRSADILMNYMGSMPINNSHFYKDIFWQLIQQKYFPQFLDSLRFQNDMMSDKYVLRRLRAQNQQAGIVAITQSSSLFLNDSFYQNSMQEEPKESPLDFNVYPVQVYALRAGWIVSSNEGLEFLEQLFDFDDNLEIFRNETIVMIIEYLHVKFLSQLQKVILPQLILQIIIYALAIYFSEQTLKRDWTQKIQDDGSIKWTLAITEFSQPQLRANLLAQIFGGLNFGFTVLDIYILFRQSILRLKTGKFLSFFIGNDTFKIFHLIFLFINGVQSIFQVLDISHHIQRSLAAFSVLLLAIRILQILKMFKTLQHHIDSCMEIFTSTLSFLIVLLLICISFVFSIYFIGQDDAQYQIKLPQLSVVSFQNSIMRVWLILNGALPEDDYKNIYGDETGVQILLICYIIIASLVISILMMNMLIAIMNDSFSFSKPVRQQKRFRQKLGFVLDSWIYRHWVIGDKKSSDMEIKYIICATMLKDRQDGDGLLNELAKDQVEIKNQIQKLHEKINRTHGDFNQRDEQINRKMENIKKVLELTYIKVNGFTTKEGKTSLVEPDSTLFGRNLNHKTKYQKP